MNEFKNYHPSVNFIYFVFTIGFSCVFMHPFCLAVSIIFAFTMSVMQRGARAIKANLMYMLPMMLLTALINPAFNHEGVTILVYLPGGNPLTLESIVYGLSAAVMLAGVICHFSCYNEVMTSDKFIYLFGKAIPALSLIISMTLRFVPRFTAQLRIVTASQKCIGRDMQSTGVVQKAKNGLAILSIMTTWALENAVDTADSMKSRGYGLPGRTAFSVFRFDKRDKTALIIISVLGLYTLVGGALGGMYFRYFPNIKSVEISPFSISVFAAHLLLLAFPVILEILEVRRWKALKSKI